MFCMREQSDKGCSFVMEVHMGYVVMIGIALWVLFCVARSLIVVSHRADEQMRKFMQIGEEYGVYERS